MADGLHSFHGPQWEERLSVGFRHVQTWATSKLPSEWRLLLAISVFVVALEIAFSTPIWLCLVLVLQGSAVALLLQQIADPTPIFWTVPAEAWNLIGSNKARVNHLWLHRTQTLLSDGAESKHGVGYATSDGFVLMDTEVTQLQVFVAAGAAWYELAEDRCDGRSLKGCKAYRLIAATLFLLFALPSLLASQRLDVGNFLLAVMLSSVAGYAAARRVERIIGSWTTSSVWREEKAGMNEVVVAPFTLPRLWWFKGGEGFFVRRVGAGLPQSLVQ
ncbi:MAG: hypothetical protein M1453_08095 [Acidobacteria bacterium]|nr:hypothetical protein [Acidobacteriota bacterium]MCL5287938.1 hypothetical protein [Acidobacteriota bacterium]